MSDLNDLKLQGRLTKDAIIKNLSNNKKIALFTLAVNQTKKNVNGEYLKEANFFPISAFIQSDKIISYLKKGQPLIVEGYLKQITKQTYSDGLKTFESKIFICTKKLHIIFTGNNETENKTSNPEYSQDEYIYEEENNTEDVFINDLELM